MTYIAPQSRCCGAPVRTDGGPVSWFYRCTMCAQPCDADPVPPVSRAAQAEAMRNFMTAPFVLPFEPCADHHG
jgi:hypothetical protein